MLLVRGRTLLLPPIDRLKADAPLNIFVIEVTETTYQSRYSSVGCILELEHKQLELETAKLNSSRHGGRNKTLKAAAHKNRRTPNNRVSRDAQCLDLQLAVACTSGCASACGTGSRTNVALSGAT
jgi:hypothetical protein